LVKAYAAVSGDTPEAKIARQYIDEALAAAEKFILIRAAELDAMGEGTVAAEWSSLVLLLHHKDEDWNRKLIGSFPEWMRSMQSLKAAEYICLSVARPLAAYQLWGYQVSGDREEVLELNSYLTNLHRRANACFGSKDFLKGIAIIKSIVVLSEAKGMIDEAVKSHFRLAEVYTMYGHSQMAADEMKLMMTDYPAHKEYGKAVLMRLRYLYQSGMYEKILEETPALLKEKASGNYHPQIIYIAWVTNRRQNKTMEADDLKKRFIRDYPNHPLCADMYFASAMELLAAGDYAGATQLLEMISERYEKTSIANKSREILAKLKESQKPPSGTPTPTPNGG
jgi:tetratricopeptide (TPR) repeat protein